MRLADEVAIVTGAARGIGKAIALALKAEGALLVLSDVSDEVHKTVAEIEAAGGRAVGIVGNVVQSDDCESMVKLELDT